MFKRISGEHKHLLLTSNGLVIIDGGKINIEVRSAHITMIIKGSSEVTIFNRAILKLIIEDNSVVKVENVNEDSISDIHMCSSSRLNFIQLNGTNNISCFERSFLDMVAHGGSTHVKSDGNITFTSYGNTEAHIETKETSESEIVNNGNRSIYFNGFAIYSTHHPSFKKYGK